MSETPDNKKPVLERQENAKTISRGERLFNWLVYGGIAGVVVFIASVPIAFLGEQSSNAWGRLCKAGAAKLKNMGFSAKVADDAVMTTSLMMGGNAAILPVKALENYKPQIVGKFNKVLGDEDTRDIEKEPKQTWTSLIGGRLIAWGAVMLSFRTAAWKFPETFNKFKHEFSENIICKPFGKATHELKTIDGVTKEVETVRYQLGKIASLDLFATAAASILLFIGSRFFAKKTDRAKNDLTTFVPLREEEVVLAGLENRLHRNHHKNDLSNKSSSLDRGFAAALEPVAASHADKVSQGNKGIESASPAL